MNNHDVLVGKFWAENEWGLFKYQSTFDYLVGPVFRFYDWAGDIGVGCEYVSR